MKHTLSILMLSLLFLANSTSCKKSTDAIDTANEGHAAQALTSDEMARQEPIKAESDQPNDNETDSTKPNADSKRISDVSISGFPKSEDANKTWSNINVHLLTDSPQNNDPKRIIKELTPILQKWNQLHNARNASSLAKLVSDDICVRGACMDRNTYAQKMKTSFAKYKDYKQVPESDVYVNYISGYNNEPVEYWSVRFNESFTQNGQTTSTEILLAFSRFLTDDDQSDWRIIGESDISTDRNMMNKLGISQLNNEISPCAELKYHIVTESPAFRIEIGRNYQAFTDANAKMAFEQDGANEYHLYEKQEDHNATLNWYSFNPTNRTISAMYGAEPNPIDTRFDQIYTELCPISDEDIE